jgi:hypothetical protein
MIWNKGGIIMGFSLSIKQNKEKYYLFSLMDKQRLLVDFYHYPLLSEVVNRENK